MPLLADLLAVPTGDRYPPLNMTPQKRKEQMLAALTAQVEGLSAREPVRREEQRSAPNNQVNIVTCGRPRHGGANSGRKVMIANTRRTERRSTSKSRDSRVVGSLQCTSSYNHQRPLSGIKARCRITSLLHLGDRCGGG